MGMFSLIRRARQQAKEVQAKQEEQKKKEAQKVPYKHVPKHAAVDALHSAPSGWSAEDRPKIIEQNQRRSARMSAAVNLGTNSRANLSTTSVPFPSVHSLGGIPRTYSYSGPSSRQSLRSVLYADGLHMNGGKGKEPMLPIASGGELLQPASGNPGLNANPEASDDAPLEMKVHPSGSKHTRPASYQVYTYQNGRPYHVRRASGTSLENCNSKVSSPANNTSKAAATHPAIARAKSTSTSSIPPVPPLPRITPNSASSLVQLGRSTQTSSVTSSSSRRSASPLESASSESSVVSSPVSPDLKEEKATSLEKITTETTAAAAAESEGADEVGITSPAEDVALHTAEDKKQGKPQTASPEKTRSRGATRFAEVDVGATMTAPEVKTSVFTVRRWGFRLSKTAAVA